MGLNEQTEIFGGQNMNDWILYAVGAAVFYGLHQIFTKLAAPHIGDGLGGLVVESTAALTIAAYLIYLRLSGQWNQTMNSSGVWYSLLTGVCVGIGTILFFVLFQKGGPLSAVPMVLAGGAAIMALAGLFIFKEPFSWARIIGIALSIGGLFLLKS
jgi:transporter family protein